MAYEKWKDLIFLSSTWKKNILDGMKDNRRSQFHVISVGKMEK